LTAGLQFRENLEHLEIAFHRRGGDVTMRGATLVVLLAAASLVTIWSFISSAQAIDSNACEQSCYEQKTICVSACETHTNPVECEAQCDDELIDCLKQCR
jgi:hypothetical protein